MDAVSVFSSVWYSITPFNLRFFFLILGNVSIISSNTTTFHFFFSPTGTPPYLWASSFQYVLSYPFLLPSGGSSAWSFNSLVVFQLHPSYNLLCFYFNYYILHTNISCLVLICDFPWIFYFSSIFPYLFEYSFFAYFKFSLLVILLQVIYGVQFVFFFLNRKFSPHLLLTCELMYP